MTSHSPQRIAQSFVKQYYDILAKKPEELHRFYANESTFTHAEDPREEVELVQTGVEAIKKRVAELNYLNAHVDLSEGFLDVQKSISSSESILVVVTGHFSLREIKSRPFTHSFVLAVPTAANSGRPGSYYVHNSVFRLISERSTPTASKGVEASPEAVDASNLSKSVSGTSEQKNSKQVGASKTPPAPDKSAAAEAEAEVATEKTKQEANEKADAEKADAEKAAADAVANTAPKSYADMAKRVSSAPPPQPPSSVRLGAKKSSAETEKSSISKESTKEASKKGGDKAPGGENHASIYVRNFTSEVTETELRDLFAPFGDVIRVDISSGKGFAFIDFDSRSTMMTVLGAKSPFMLHGNTLKVEERSSKGPNKSSSVGGGAGTGRDKDSGRKEGRKADTLQGKSGDSKKSDSNGEGKKRVTSGSAGGAGARKGQSGKDSNNKQEKK